MDVLRSSLDAVLLLASPAGDLSLSALLVALAVRVALLLVAALVLRLALARLPWLPLPLALLSLAHWHQSVRALVSCTLYGGAGCSVSALVSRAGALRVVDAASSYALRLAHLLVATHEFALPYAALYLFGALTVGGVSFWYLHALFLAVDVHAPKQTPRRVLWAADLLAWLEAASLLGSTWTASAAVSHGGYAALLNALPFSLAQARAASPGVRSVHVEQALAAVVVLAWFVPRLGVPSSRVLTWALRVLLVAACALNVSLALSLAIAALRLWPLHSGSVPTVGVYGLVR